MKFKTNTLGCKVNLYETEALINDLEAKGWQHVNEGSADVVIINSCSVTQMSDVKSRKLIRKTVKIDPNAMIVVMGCYSQLNAEEALSENNVAVVMGTKNRLKVYDLINKFIETKEKINDVKNINEFVEYEEMKVGKLTQHTRGFIKIQDGCENFCSYCTIPYARGKIKSRDSKKVIEEIKELVNTGVKEVILSGINTGTYGVDHKDISLAQLIDLICTEVPNLFRLRLSSIELMEVTDELLSVIKKHNNVVAHHLHIPLQGGCNNTLTRMRRKYNIEEYFALIAKIRNMLGNIAITTDCLAGFVGETEEDFNESLINIEKLNFASMHVFPYSRRKNTSADKMEGHLPKEIISKRAHIIGELANKLQNNYSNEFVGSTLEVLVEDKKNGVYRAHTSNYLEVYFIGEPNLENTIVNVKITKIDNNKCKGVIINEF